MTLVIPEQFGSVIHSLRWTGDPEPMAVTYGVASSAASVGAVGDLCDALAQAFVDNLLPVLSEVITLVQTELRFQLDAPPADPVIAASTIGGEGEETGTVLPQNSAYLCHKRTATGGRGGRGRFYLPAVPEVVVDNLGNITSGEQGEMNTALAAFLVDVTGVGDGMVVLHDDAGAHAADPPRLVTLLVCDPVIATQRRRLRR